MGTKHKSLPEPISKKTKKIVPFISLVIAIIFILIFSIYPEEIDDTNISGFKLRSQKWSGIIKVTGDVIFFPFSTLTILPGTKVYFEKLRDADLPDEEWISSADKFIKDADDPTGKKGYEKNHFSIYGKIIAIGTEELPITFTSAEKNPEYADWDKLTLLEDSLLEYVNLSFAHNGITIVGKDVTIRKSIIHDSLWSCIDIYSKGNIIEDNEIYHCWHQGIGVKKENENEIISNHIHDSMLSVNCELGSSPKIKNNLIWAAPLNLNCTDDNNTIVHAMPDVAGGTYLGMLVYKPYYTILR
jgi:parallel beta-helix repeat protein